MDTPQVSIVVLTYNQQEYIRDTLDSILSQRHQYEYEIIVCDDSSTDKTPQIIIEYSQRYKEIKPILRNQNIGLARNFIDGIGYCKGEYIMACAGDDYYLPNKIKTQVEYLNRNPHVGMVHGDVDCIDRDGKYLFTSYGPKEVSYLSLIKSNTIKAPTIAVRRKEILRYIKDVVPEEKNWSMEDKPMVIWFAIESVIRYLPGACVAYRILEGSVSHPTTPNRYIEFINSSFDICRYFQNRYPHLLSNSYIANNHVDNLLAYLPNGDKEYRDYCIKVIHELKEFQIRNYKLRQLRSRFPVVNKGWNILKRIINIFS